MTPVAEQPSLLKSFARSALPRPARNWLRSPIESGHDVYDEGLFQLGVVRRHEIRPGWGGPRPARDITLVPTVTIDALAAEYRVTPTHLKIDVEGDEASVLAGARATLTAGGRRPTVFLELHNDILRARGEAPGRVLQELGAWGYRLEAPSGAPLTADAAVRPRVTRLVALPSE